MFRRLDKGKAAGPDNISPACLYHCSDQLAPVHTGIFNSSLEQLKIPAPYKKSIIIPIPKKGKTSSLNDYRPVALTSVAMKVLERIALSHLKHITSPLMDTLQFAYRSNRSTDDAVNLALHFTLEHLESKDTYARILFIDFSSAFNTINPLKLFHSLTNMNTDPSLCFWLLDTLKGRTQVVRLHDHTSLPLTTNIGVPQGCVLSPWLFSLYTNNLRSASPSVKLLKYADDTTIVGLISDNLEDDYRSEVERTVNLCRDLDLILNESKTVELIADFRKVTPIKAPIIINNQPISATDSFKFLGTHINNKLNWDHHTTHLLKTANQRLFHLRQLRKYRIRKNVMIQFYTAIIQNILCLSITSWYGNTPKHTLHRLNRVIKRASKIIKHNLPTLDSLYQHHSITRATKIIQDPSHPANHLFRRLPSRRRITYESLGRRTKRFNDSFFPSAVRLLNS